MIRISISRAGAPVGEHTLQGQITVGRATDRDIVLSDPQVSRLHLVIEESGGQCTVIDQGSRNGTTVEGRRLTKNMPTPWAHGQELAIREFVLVASVEAPAGMGGAGAELNYEHTFVMAGDEPAGNDDAASAAVEPPVAQPMPVSAPAASAPSPEPSPATASPGVGGGADAWTSGERAFVIADVLRESHDARTVRLLPVEPMSMRYLPGQTVAVSMTVDGHPVRRTFSLSSSPTRPMALEVTFKREPNEPVSDWLAERVEVGEHVTVEAPAGSFSCVNFPSQKVLFLGAGSGIAPLMGMLRWITDLSAKVDVVMLNSVRTPGDLLFAQELQSITARHPSVAVMATVTRSRSSNGGWLGMSGRLNESTLRAAVPDLAGREVFVSGPPSFSASMADCLRSAGVPEAQIHAAAQGAAIPQPNPTAPPVPAVRPDAPGEDPVLGPDGSFGTMIMDHFEVPEAEAPAEGQDFGGEAMPTYIPPPVGDQGAQEGQPGQGAGGPQSGGSRPAEPTPFEDGQTYIPPPTDVD